MAGLKRMCTWALVLMLSLTRGAQGADLFDIPPTNPPREVKSDYFGTHFHRLWAPDAPFNKPTAWPTDQIGTIRLWDSNTRWADLEPRPGQFMFDRLDYYMSKAEEHKVPVIMVLGSPPRWASARSNEPGPYGPGSAAEPDDIDDWDRYVTTLVRRYKGRIAHYELWNEPYFSEMPGDRTKMEGILFFTGSVKKMVELAQHARAILDREDPAAVLLTPGIDRFPYVLDAFLTAGGGGYVGGVAFHYYVHADTDREFLLMHQGVKAVLARHQLSALPIFNTETGFDSRDVNAVTGGLLMARQMILGAFVGLERYYQHGWDNGHNGVSGTAGGPPESRSGEAYAAVRRWLLGTRLEGCHRESNDVMVCKGTRAGKVLLIAWRFSGVGTKMWRLPAGAHAESIERAVSDSQLNALDLDERIAVSGNPVAIVLKQTGP